MRLAAFVVLIVTLSIVLVSLVALDVRARRGGKRAA